MKRKEIRMPENLYEEIQKQKLSSEDICGLIVAGMNNTEYENDFIDIKYRLNNIWSDFSAVKSALCEYFEIENADFIDIDEEEELKNEKEI